MTKSIQGFPLVCSSINSSGKQRSNDSSFELEHSDSNKKNGCHFVLGRLAFAIDNGAAQIENNPKNSSQCFS